MEDLLLQLLAGILTTAVVSGSLFVCTILYKRIITKWRQNSRGPPRLHRAPTSSSPDSDSGEQRPLPQPGALHDIEIGPMNSVANLPNSSSSDNGCDAEENMEITGTPNTAGALNKEHQYSGEAVPG